MTPGDGLSVVVNKNAKRGGRRVAAQIARALSGASVRLTKTPDEIDSWLRMLPERRAILSAGGDGSAVALINALRKRAAPGPLPTIGLLPLGTGNGWAHASGAPKLDRCLRILGDHEGPFPVRPYTLFEVDDTYAHFAGSGWDAMVLNDYKSQLAESRGPSKLFTKSVYGYITASLFRTAPKVLLDKRPRVVIQNLGDEVFTITADGKLLRLEGVRHGDVIYDGTFGGCSVGTCPEFGYRFKAFPFAERLPGFFSIRLYDQGAVGGVFTIPSMWRGDHPMKQMTDLLATKVKMSFSRPVPLQIGGDACGEREMVTYSVAPHTAHVIDWRRLV